MNDPIRDVIVHYHIFKNAGTTIDALLHANFPHSHGAVEGELPWDILSSDQLQQYILANPTLKVVSSHQARLPLPEHTSLRIHPIVFLRHPIDRVESIYQFERHEPDTHLSPGIQIAKNTDLKGFVEWGLSENGTAVFRNFQTIHLAGRETDMRYAAATQADFLVASARLRELSFVGIVDRFDASIQQLRQVLKPIYPDLQLTPSLALNTSIGRSNLLSARIARISEALGNTLLNELIKANQFDLELYWQHTARDATAAFVSH
ncbi:sulfotransferase family 2 domain-containing protein [Cupriavidus necator]|uniref:Sulfotransferase n=1 Tax=Cupriavidus pinatubonensis (strain JMP 134 / LMG 1197) TaxID=264198 RepID=Q474R5_CUPPJ|nr:sulfotransferase family 2 domain-containing protein [Cupriavidus necator]